jgi:hypothetical protein
MRGKGTKNFSFHTEFQQISSSTPSKRRRKSAIFADFEARIGIEILRKSR